VRISVRHGKRTLASRIVKVRATCRFSNTLRVAKSHSLGKRGRLAVVIRFQGNRLLRPKSITRHVAYGPKRR
jgi:hypothetical protein